MKIYPFFLAAVAAVMISCLCPRRKMQNLAKKAMVKYGG